MCPAARPAQLGRPGAGLPRSGAARPGLSAGQPGWQANAGGRWGAVAACGRGSTEE
jgi:hypothetical protein